MKKRKKCILVCIVSFVSALFVLHLHSSSDQATQNGLTMFNIEALSEGERSNEVICSNPGSLDCPYSETKVLEVIYKKKQ